MNNSVSKKVKFNQFSCTNRQTESHSVKHNMQHNTTLKKKKKSARFWIFSRFRKTTGKCMFPRFYRCDDKSGHFLKICGTCDLISSYLGDRSLFIQTIRNITYMVIHPDTSFFFLTRGRLEVVGEMSFFPV